MLCSKIESHAAESSRAAMARAAGRGRRCVMHCACCRCTSFRVPLAQPCPWRRNLAARTPPATYASHESELRRRKLW